MQMLNSKLGFGERGEQAVLLRNPLKEWRKYVIHIQQIKSKLVIHFVAGILSQA